MCSALVSPHGFKNDVYFTCSVCLFRDIFCVTRELTSKSPIDFCQEELSPSDPIESVCHLFQPPSLLLTLTSGTTDQAPCTHFRFRSRSDSIRLRVKSTRLRLSVLDMYGGLFRSRSDSIRLRVKSTRLRLSVLDMYVFSDKLLMSMCCITH